jgi:excinuclease ABC subunit B
MAEVLTTWPRYWLNSRRRCNPRANRLEFERAAVLRDQIDALKSGDYRKPAASPRMDGRAKRAAAAVRKSGRRPR